MGSSGLQRVTGCPAWSTAGVTSGLVALGLSMTGFYWDVARHVDQGRDIQLFTVPHTLILAGMVGLLLAAFVAVAVATVERAPVGLRLGTLRVPWSALLLVVFRVGALAAFFVDDLWHRAYGMDVTLWSPVHLVLLAGGSLSAVALWLMVVEGSQGGGPTALGRVLHVATLGAVLVGLSTYQAEFDYGVPQFQVGYLPVLLAAASAAGLVLSRLALGPGGAVMAAGAFVVMRLGASLLVGGALGHTAPSFPLYLVAAACVEAAAAVVGTSRSLRFAVVAGALVGTLGLAGEWWWAAATGGHHLPLEAVPGIVLASVVAAVSGAVLALGLVTAAAGGEGVRPARVVASGAALALVVGWLALTDVGRVNAVVHLHPVADEALVELELSPPDAAEGSAVFDVLAVQGGGRVSAELRALGPGRYVASRPVPVGGQWKTVVRLFRGNQVMAAPVHLPADPSVGAPAVPALEQRQTEFQDLPALLQRERHGGSVWPAVIAYACLAAVVGIWLVLLTVAVRRLAPAPPPVPDAPTQARRVRIVAGAGPTSRRGEGYGGERRS